MEKIRREDIKTVPDYEPIRDRSRREVIALKKTRRVSVGECVTLVFENRRTVIHQIQEMMRAEHLYDEALIRHEIETYNRLIPDQGQLSATLFIEIQDPQQVKPTLDRLHGIEAAGILVPFDDATADGLADGDLGERRCRHAVDFSSDGKDGDEASEPRLHAAPLKRTEGRYRRGGGEHDDQNHIPRTHLRVLDKQHAKACVNHALRRGPPLYSHRVNPLPNARRVSNSWRRRRRGA